jgi:uncharacterized membrane protein
MESEGGVERMVFFTDAVVAIAITLLILPLVDSVGSFAANKSHTVDQFLYDNLSQLFAFGLSFVIIARMWLANHRILANTVRSSTLLMWLDIAWVFTIVVLPLPTEITAVFRSSSTSAVLYISTCLASTLLLTALCFYLYRHPELEKEKTRISAIQLWDIATIGVGFVLALALVLIFPRLTYYSILVLLLATPVGWIVKPRILRREAARVPAKK